MVTTESTTESTTKSTTKQVNVPSDEHFLMKTGKPFHFYWKSYYDKLVYFLNRYCKDPQMAEDMAVDTFLISLQKIDKYDKDKSQFSTWLFTIGRNHTIQTLDRRKNILSIDAPMDDEGSTILDFLQDVPPYEEEKHIVILKKAEIMRKHIDQLNEPYRQVIQLREIENMPYKDIADILDRNLSTIKSQIRNGRSLLIKKTEDEFRLIDNLYGIN